MELKNKIKEIRKRLHLTQEKFAEELGIETGYIGHIETGLRQPGRKTINRICSVFNIDPREFFETEKKAVIKKKDVLSIEVGDIPERDRDLITKIVKSAIEVSTEGKRDLLKHTEEKELCEKIKKRKRKTA